GSKTSNTRPLSSSSGVETRTQMGSASSDEEEAQRRFGVRDLGRIDPAALVGEPLQLLGDPRAVFGRDGQRCEGAGDGAQRVAVRRQLEQALLVGDQRR